MPVPVLGTGGAGMYNTQSVLNKGFPGGASGKEAPPNARDITDTGSIPGSGRSAGEGHGNPLQCSCQEPGRLQSMGHKELDMTERLSMHARSQQVQILVEKGKHSHK